MKLLKVKDVAEMLSVDPATVRRYINDGTTRKSDGKVIKLKAQKLTNGTLRVSPIDLDDYKAEWMNETDTEEIEG